MLKWIFSIRQYNDNLDTFKVQTNRSKIYNSAYIYQKEIIIYNKQIIIHYQLKSKYSSKEKNELAWTIFSDLV
jgi:hypothetical protein